MDSEKWLNILLSGITSALIAVIIPMIVDRKKAWREARYKLIQDFQNIYMKWNGFQEIHIDSMLIRLISCSSQKALNCSITARAFGSKRKNLKNLKRKFFV